MTFTNQTKNSSSTTNVPKSSAGALTWDEATFSWDDAVGTWDNPFAFHNQAKNTSAITNQTKS